MLSQSRKEGGDISFGAWLQWVQSVMAEEDNRAGKFMSGQAREQCPDATLS